MTSYHEKMESDISATITALVAPTSSLSCADANQRISAIGTDYLNAYAQSTAAEDEADNSRYGNSTPGVPRFFLTLWETIVEHVHNAPVEGEAHDEHIARLVNLVGEIKGNSQGDWVAYDQNCGWKDLPFLGQTIRDNYNEPIETAAFDTSALLSPESQTALAGASNSEGTAQLVAARHKWLSLQSFLSRLWRDCDCSEYALYAIWALRDGLEEFPSPPPESADTFEESPAYLAFQVEAAAIWIINSAPLMYKCTEIWGPNGNPDWPRNGGRPGRGGKRWAGVDGYDREHARWEVWKGVLGEVIEWSEGKGWKVRDVAARAMEVMREVERR